MGHPPWPTGGLRRGGPSTPNQSEARSPATADNWLVGPWFDSLLIANVAWPLLVLVQWDAFFDSSAGLQFWQLYYITTPHRWITLGLVFLDRERFRHRAVLFLGIAAIVVLVCLGVRFSTGTLTCLLAIDYVWNAWHFAAQHHGIHRIYERRSGVQESFPSLQKWTLRGVLLYVILRVASATWADASFDPWLRTADWLVPLVFAALLIAHFRPARDEMRGGTTYLLSVTALYLALVAAVHTRNLPLVLALATASALFHAIEYLALVTWSVGQRHAGLGNRMGLMSHLAARWGLALGTFVVILGAGGWLLDQRYVEAWLTINVIVAFLHYAYDGLIWRRRAV